MKLITSNHCPTITSTRQMSSLSIEMTAITMISLWNLWTNSWSIWIFSCNSKWQPITNMNSLWPTSSKKSWIKIGCAKVIKNLCLQWNYRIKCLTLARLRRFNQGKNIRMLTNRKINLEKGNKKNRNTELR